ncbi:Las1-like-domain-containing protein [Cantharellus anzutake]|uniref:Las1-like-domain-containing protein n=1 Tax=Cantharellus anzutake TaxID=1750568 RepID=UPI0019078666|nr:Las1-like-domain-containing protein [Cantharellus anzutake]KAF8334244.1 Las1-like-domain-containing protein [Cantharellus anzutake]
MPVRPPLPRRVPWASISELEEVCSWIFSDAADEVSKRKALAKLAAWRVATVLPHSIESTWLILGAVLLDHSAVRREVNGSSFLGVRQAYALAIVRTVNGLVDPLQKSLYAKPLSYLAGRIGLPQWLVELRHATTHEALPSLELLREAATQSMSWIFQNYWIPTLHPGEALQTPLLELALLAPLLQEYKSSKKALIKDATLKKTQITAALRQLERWIDEASAAWRLGPGRNAHQDGGSSWAIDQLCTELVKKGGIVPKSKKKRLQEGPSNESSLSYLELWGQLLLHVQIKHHKFASYLLDRIISTLTNAPEEDPSFHECLSNWVIWVVEKWGHKDVDCTREDALSLLLFEVGRIDSFEMLKYRPMIHSLCGSDSDLEQQIETLLQTRSNTDVEVSDFVGLCPTPPYLV